MERTNNNVIVTIAIPFYNADRYLKEAIESVLWQTYHDWELLLINDGSTDSSLEIANGYANKDKRIKVYSDGENKNLGYRLNQIPNLIDTEYLVRMDADDIMHPQKIEKQINTMLSDPSIDVLGTNAYSIDENNDVVGIRFALRSENLVSCNGFIHPTIMAKRSWFINNPYDVTAIRIEDSELWLRTTKSNSFKMLTEPLFFYREFGEDYYRKYFKAFPSLFYILKKHRFRISILAFVVKYVISSFVYWGANLLGKESILILRRNQVLLSKKKYHEFI